MHRHKSRRKTDAEEAAQILRDYKRRIEKLEEDGTGVDETVQLFRAVHTGVACSTSLEYEMGDAFAFEWNTSEWGFDEWSDGT